MSATAHSHRAEKLRVDRALSRVYASHRHEAPFLRAFDALTLEVRRRSPLLRPVLRPAVHDPVEALSSLASFHGEFLRPLTTWRPRGASVLELVDSLAAHLLARYPTPRFLASVWFGPDDAERREQRRWVIAHARGAPFRRAGLPLVMTRRMEHEFLRTPDHLGLVAAMRRAEVLVLGGSRALAESVVATRLGRDLAHATFWTGVVRFLVRHESAIGPSAVAAIVESLHELRHVSVEVRSAHGLRRFEPRAPHLSLKGRTPASLLRLVSQVAGDPSCSWRPSGLAGLVYEEPPAGERPPARWCVVELRDRHQLAAEGQALRHCVRTYAGDCRAGPADRQQRPAPGHLVEALAAHPAEGGAQLGGCGSPQR